MDRWSGLLIFVIIGLGLMMLSLVAGYTNNKSINEKECGHYVLETYTKTRDGRIVEDVYQLDGCVIGEDVKKEDNYIEQIRVYKDKTNNIILVYVL